MDPCPGAGKVARRQRVRNVTTAFLRRTTLGLLALSLLALAACAHSPPRPRESLPQQAPVAVVAPAAATDASTPAPIAPTDLPAAAPDGSTAATDGLTPAPVAPTAATDGSTPAPVASTAATDPAPVASTAALTPQPAMPEPPPAV